MKKIQLSLVAFAAAFAAGCASQAQQAGPPAAPTKVAASTAKSTSAVAPAAAAPAAAPGTALPKGVTSPPAGKGQIVFFRPSRFVGSALTFTVRENNVDLGKLPNARYFVQVAEPGIHAYEIGRNDTMRVEVEAGETYYAIQSTQMGVFAGRAVLSPSDGAAFEAALPNMKVSEPVKAAK